MRLGATVKAVIGIAVPLSLLSGVAAARRGDRPTESTRPFLAPAIYPIGGPVRQHDGHSIGAASAGFRVAIDGALNPDAISDERAYGLFLSAVSSLESIKARESLFRRVGLSPVDRSAFTTALGPLNADLKALAEQRKAGRIPAGQGVLQQRNLLDAARNQVWLSLSPAGRRQLDDYIRTHVKPRVKIYRGPSMSSSEAGSLQ